MTDPIQAHMLAYLLERRKAINQHANFSTLQGVNQYHFNLEQNWDKILSFVIYICAEIGKFSKEEIIETWCFPDHMFYSYYQKGKETYETFKTRDETRKKTFSF
jgi:hypothetical protein